MNIQERLCGNCRYFILHYVRWGKEGQKIRYMNTSFGHCKEGKRIKHMYNSKKGCVKWENKTISAF